MTHERTIFPRMDVDQNAQDDPFAKPPRQPLRQPSRQSRETFREAMQEPVGQPHIAGRSPTSEETTVPHGLIPLPAGSQPAMAISVENKSLDPERWRDLQDVMSRLLVSDRNSHREVRIDVNENVMPGVRIRVLETEGRVTFCLVCSVAHTRQRLTAIITGLSQALADRLQRPVLLQICADGCSPSDMSESLANPQARSRDCEHEPVPPFSARPASQ